MGAIRNLGSVDLWLPTVKQKISVFLSLFLDLFGLIRNWELKMLNSYLQMAEQ